MENIVYPAGSAETASGHATNRIGSCKLTFTAGQSGVASAGTVFLTKNWRDGETGRVIDIRDNVGNPLGWAMGKNYVEGSATVSWPMATMDAPAVGWEALYYRYSGTSNLQEYLVVTGVTNSRTDSEFRSIEITWRRKSV